MTSYIVADLNTATLDQLIGEVWQRLTREGEHSQDDAADIAIDYLHELGFSAGTPGSDAFAGMQSLMEAIIQLNSKRDSDRAREAYPYIVAWGRYMRSNESFITDQCLDAARYEAPAGAYTRSYTDNGSRGQWETIATLPPAVLHSLVTYLPKAHN